MFLSQAAQLKGDSGTALPSVYPTLDRNDIRFTRGSSVLIGAGPGTGKSMFVLNYVLDAGCKTLYVSPDTNKGDTVARVAQRLTGNLRTVVEAQLEEGPDVYPDLYARLDKIRHIDFNFKSGIDLDDVRNLIFAYCEKFGEWPELVVIDNLVNLIVDQSNPGEWQMTMQDLDDIAKDIEACVMVLTHVAGHKEGGTDPIGQADILYKVTKSAATVLTLTRDSMDPTRFLIACVKNRNGKADPSGYVRYTLKIRRETCHIWDPLTESTTTSLGLNPTTPVVQNSYTHSTPGLYTEPVPNLERMRAFIELQDTS